MLSELFAGSGLLAAAGLFVLGGLLLFLGRRIYWLLIALTGFLVGLWAGVGLFSGVDSSLRPWLVLGFSLLAVGLAFLAQKAVLALSGALALGAAGYLLCAGMASWVQWGAVIVLALLGALLMAAVFNWGLVICSSFLGAVLVAGALSAVVRLPAAMDLPLVAVLVAAGLLVQGRDLIRLGR